MKNSLFILLLLLTSCFRQAGGAGEPEQDQYEVTVTILNQSDYVSRLLKYFRIHEAIKVIMSPEEEGSARASKVTVRLNKIVPFTERELQQEIEEMDGVEKVTMERVSKADAGT